MWGFFLINFKMKYARLTLEQFEELHEEFSLFLASQSIDKKKWDELKSQNSNIVAEEMDLFSDMVWDRTLEKVEYLENLSENHLFLFKRQKKSIDLILIKSNENSPSLTSEGAWQWLLENIMHSSVTIFQSSKAIDGDFKVAIFGLIKNGASIAKADRFEQIKSFLSK